MSDNTTSVFTSKAASRSHFDLSQTHLTTLDFGQILPLYNRSVLPGDEFNIDFSLFSRVSPLMFPAYVNANLRAVCAYVPYYLVFDRAEDFFSGIKQFHDTVIKLPRISAYELDMFFLRKSHSLIYKAPTSRTSDFDLVIRGNDDISFFGSGNYMFTYRGRYVYKILRSLGYNLSQSIDTSSSGYEDYSINRFYNALPLLSFFRVYLDWFSNMQDYNKSVILKTLNDIKNQPDEPIHYTELYTLFSNLRLLYSDDYVTTAWRFSNSITSQSSFSLSVPSSLVSRTVNFELGYNFTPIPVSNNNCNLTDLQLKFLNSLSNFIKRNNYAGTKAAQRVLSRFGIKTEDYRSNYADIIHVRNIPLQIGDVTQTSESSENSPLGSQAGKGVVVGQDNVKVNISDFGHIFILGYISVKDTFPSAIHPDILKTDTYDFYQPEFDGVGVVPISYDEVTCDPSDNNNSTFNGPSVFGFTERYNEYRHGFDQVTGDFALRDDFKPWYLSRDTSQWRNESYKAQSDSVIYYSNSRPSNYGRIFAYFDPAGNTSQDHFFLSCYFDVKANRPIKSLSESINLGDGSIELAKDGNVLN